MIDNNIAWFFAFGFAVVAFMLLAKHYIDSKVNKLERSIESTDRLIFDEDAALRNCLNKRIDNIENEMERNRTNVWREIDSLWDNKEAKCDKAMSKNYYNSEAGTNCCKSAAEYLKG